MAQTHTETKAEYGAPSFLGLAFWQFGMAALVTAIVIVGGLTRLTDSGLSITEWNVVTGILPPLSTEAWLSEFDKYKLIPEFTEVNYDMTLAEFKVIYWWEWGHRILGRVLGLAFLIPFLFLWLRGRIPAGKFLDILTPGVLIAIQGFIGWWMVSSGLTERVDVAPYRLATHLGMAFLIFAVLGWTGFKLQRGINWQAQRSSLNMLAGFVILLFFIQILSGALVAGLDAGRGYTDWPMMQGYFLPPEATEMTPFWVNIFENPALAQFDHRIIAYILLAATLFLWIRSRGQSTKRARRWVTIALLVTLAQSGWGIFTLINGAPWNLALAHQFGALVLLFCLIRMKFEIRYPKRNEGEA